MAQQNRRRRRWLWVTLGMVVAAGSSAAYFLYDDEELPPRVAIDSIEPGTVIGDGPPEGWSHLVIKSIPRVPPEERGKVMGFMSDMAELISTITLANVRFDESGGTPSYFLDKIAVGMGVKINGMDTVVTPETAKDLGADVGLLSGMLMKKIAKHQRQVRLAAKTRTTALMDTPAFVARPDGHRRIIIRYYYRVDAETGELDVLAWLIDLDDDGGYLDAEGPIEWLPDNMISDAVMRIDTDTIDFTGIPEDHTFAIVRIPQGESELEPGPGITKWWAEAELTADEYSELTEALDEAMDSARVGG